MQTEYDYLFKILLIGSSNVGKSSILLRYTEDNFFESYISTSGVDFKIKTIEINNNIIKLQIWDTAGQERFRSITSSYYRGAHCIIVVFDLTDNKTYNEAMNIWVDEIKKNNEKNGVDPLVFLVGNKCDTYRDPEININIEKDSKIVNEYIEVSAKNNTNIELLFNTMCEKLMKKHNIKLEQKNNINPTNVDLTKLHKILNDNSSYCSC